MVRADLLSLMRQSKAKVLGRSGVYFAAAPEQKVLTKIIRTGKKKFIINNIHYRLEIAEKILKDKELVKP